MWPKMWCILFFVEYSSLPFLSDGNCSNDDELTQAIEGIFILRHRLFVNDDAISVSGRSFP